ncbi:hypothetical protein [Bradyrhizobium sp. PRIMUS42]
MRDRLGVDLPLRALFETPVLADLAQRILPDDWEEETVPI